MHVRYPSKQQTGSSAGAGETSDPATEKDDGKAPLDSRERIVEAASHFFLSGGYNGVGIAEICGSASVHKGTFYHFFPSKTDLLLVVIERQISCIEASILEIGRRDELPDQKILALFSIPQNCYQEDAPRNLISPGQFLGNIILELAPKNLVVHAAARKALSRWSKAIEIIVEQFAKAEGVVILHTSELAGAVLGLVQGAIVMASANDEPGTMPTFGEHALTLLRSAGTGRKSA